MNLPGWGFDPSGDFLLADGLEPVALYRLRADDVFDPAVNGHGVWENPTSKNTSGVVAVDRVWHLHRPDFAAGRVPLVGDVVSAADGTQWTVTAADIGGVLDEFTCQTIRRVGANLS